MGFDLVAEDEIGAGLAGAGGGELVAELGQGLGASGGGERVKPDEELAGAGADVAGGGGASRMRAYASSLARA